ncbi:hypothetical protein ACFWBB_06120 [Streptomyces sp. NPDC060000]|uniref:hypothetical protein n=1 Tax=Streptomyces sp. NPDC060000 TaxID=3347031 RepID=UPI0036887D90
MNLKLFSGGNVHANRRPLTDCPGCVLRHNRYRRVFDSFADHEQRAAHDGSAMILAVALSILSAATTIAAALLQRSWSQSRTRMPRHESIEFRDVHESAAFSVQDVVKILDLSESGTGDPTHPGTAVLSDSYLIRRESDSGNGMVFRYASSGVLDGRCTSHTDNHVVTNYDSTHRPACKVIAILLDHLAVRSATRITNEMTFRGAFDGADGEDFETHIERPTRSLTVIVIFPQEKPCRSVSGTVRIGERGPDTETNRSNGPLFVDNGRLLYWRVLPKTGSWLPIGTTYRLQWTWPRTGAGSPPT